MYCARLRWVVAVAFLGASVANASALRASEALRRHEDFQRLFRNSPTPLLARDVLATECTERPRTHICDPEGLLSPETQTTQKKALSSFATARHSQLCPSQGYEVHVAFLDLPAEGLRTTAAELGRKWGVLGSKCANGIVALYSTRDHVLTISADHQLEERILPPKLEGYVERSSLGILRSTPDSVISSFVSDLGLVLDGTLTAESSVVEHPLLGLQGCTLVIYALCCCFVFVVVALALSCAYDAASHYFHRVHFRRCVSKIQRVHEVFQSRRGVLPLCPCCVNEVSLQPSPSVVVFLCGHRFHTTCANRFFLQKPNNRACCPICDNSAKEGEMKQNQSGNPIDEAKSFFLQSLHEQYPDIIHEDKINRWAAFHTEAWLSELECPRYNSIFHRVVDKQ